MGTGWGGGPAGLLRALGGCTGAAGTTGGGIARGTLGHGDGGRECSGSVTNTHEHYAVESTTQ